MGRERMLVQTLHSLLAQEHTDWEVVIRDDDPEHPIENHPEFQRIRDFLGEQLKYVVEPHLGSYSRVCNATLSHSTGDILHVMGSDDLLCPGALYSVNEAFEAERFGGPFWLYGKTVSTDEHLRFQGIDGSSTTYEELLQHNRIGMPSTFWNRQMLNLAGKFDTRFRRACDYDLWLRFWRRREPLFLDRELGIYRHHDDNMSKVHGQEVEAEAKKVSERHQMWGVILDRAQNAYNERHSFDGEVHISHDDVIWR